MKTLVTGANGQLGQEIKKLALNSKDLQFVFCSRAQVDITDVKQLMDFVVQNEITAILNCAAYTAVDTAESETENAYQINVVGPKNIGEIAAKLKLLVLHISTDFVFDGNHSLPYKEENKTAPLGVYGHTKLRGEKVLLESLPTATIIRTSWLYSASGSNFLNTMLRLGTERSELNVVFDQIGTPTYAGDLAAACIEVLQQQTNGNESRGVFHYSNEGVASWYDFATAIMRLADKNCKVYPIEAIAYPTPAKRPVYSVLNKSKIKTAFDLRIPHWEASLKKCISLVEMQEKIN
ncbi:MAG: dTDP-4-dehydrorhamnose reductase [Flavicella sp.]